MKSAVRLTVVAVLFVMASNSALAQSPADRFVGTWLGTISTPAFRLRVALSVARDASGALTGSMTSVDTLPVAQQKEAITQLENSQKEILDPWMRYFVTYDPRPALRKVHVPVLALDGSLDLQVPSEADRAAIDAALKEADNRDYRIVELPKPNHFFQTAPTGAPTEYATIAETFSPAALDLIATWIASHTAGKK